MNQGTQNSTYNLIFPTKKSNPEDLSVLMVGVGGIGCEILKVICKIKFREFHIIDMDTIEVSNLNRQFLFRKEHRGQAKVGPSTFIILIKSLVAKETMKKMAPELNVISHFAAINSPGYCIEFFYQFDAVIMALDNAETRSYVNKVCRALGIYLLDAGSMGFKGILNKILFNQKLGQANQYYPAFECFDCHPVVSNQKQYAACTIRSQPSNCVHCVIWAKYLFQQLFTQSAKDDDSNILEIGSLDKEMPELIFNKVFKEEIKLDLKRIESDDLEHLPYPLKQSLHGRKNIEPRELAAYWFNTFKKIYLQYKANENDLSYDKDSQLHCLFIFASTQLRCWNFGIEPYDYAQIKAISGNIIHAIASTNSIVASMEISKLLNTLSVPNLKGASYISTGKKERIITVNQMKRSQFCNACFDRQCRLQVDLKQNSVKLLVQNIKNMLSEQITIISLSRIIWDDEDEDLAESIQDKSLKDLFFIDKDNRLLIQKSIDDTLLLVLWLTHKEEVCDFQILDTKKKVLQLDLQVPEAEKKPKIIQHQSNNNGHDLENGNGNGTKPKLAVPTAAVILDSDEEDNAILID